MAKKVQDGRISPRDLSKALGVTLSQVQYAIQEGKLEGCWARDAKGRYRIDAAKATATWEREVRRAPKEVPPAARAAVSEIEGAVAKAVTLDQIDEMLASKNIRELTISEARRLELILKAKKLKLETDITAGLRVLRTVVEKEAYGEAKRIRESLTALPARMRQQGLDASFSRLLEKELDLVLQELADED